MLWFSAVIYTVLSESLIYSTVADTEPWEYLDGPLTFFSSFYVHAYTFMYIFI